MPEPVQTIISLHWKPQNRRHLPLHRNPGIELVYVKGGKVMWKVEERVWQVPSPSIFFTLPWERHGGMHEWEGGVELYYVIIPTIPGRLERPARLRFPAGLGMRAAEASRVVGLLQSAPRPFVPAKGSLPHLLTRIAEVRKQVEEPLAPLLAAYTRVALLETAGLVEEGAQHPDPDFARQTVREFLARLEADCQEPWTLEEMARVSGFGRTRLGLLVKELTGDNPIRHLNRLRVMRACRLLRESEESITAIGLRCGFCDGAYFTRVFKAFTGKSPSLYRARAQSREF